MKPEKNSGTPPVISTSNLPPKSPRPPALTRTGKTGNLPRVSNRNIKKDSDEDNWYRGAADQHHPEAQFKLGVIYANGLGVEQNVGRARSWLRAAADQGHVKADDIYDSLSLSADGLKTNTN